MFDLNYKNIILILLRLSINSIVFDLNLLP